MRSAEKVWSGVRVERREQLSVGVDNLTVQRLSHQHCHGGRNIRDIDGHSRV